MTSLEVIMFGEDNESFGAVVKILWLQVFRHAGKDRVLLFLFFNNHPLSEEYVNHGMDITKMMFSVTTKH